jgi:hypothetical protein
MFGEILELGMLATFIYVIGKDGKRHRVKVKNEEHRQKLLAQNRKMRAELKKKNKPVIKKKVIRKKKKSEWDW